MRCILIDLREACLVQDGAPDVSLAEILNVGHDLRDNGVYELFPSLGRHAQSVKGLSSYLGTKIDEILKHFRDRPLFGVSEGIKLNCGDLSAKLAILEYHCNEEWTEKSERLDVGREHSNEIGAGLPVGT